MPGLLYTKIGYITVLYVSYKDNLNCRPVNLNSLIIYWDSLQQCKFAKETRIFLIALMNNTAYCEYRFSQYMIASDCGLVSVEKEVYVVTCGLAKY